jgi:hypothetical protein
MTASSVHPSSMSMIEIRQELELLGVNVDSFIEKIEFIDALVHARKESSTKTTKLPSVSSSPKEAAVAELLVSLKLPRGLLSSVMGRYNTCYSMIWLLDNSSRMKVLDSNIVKHYGGDVMKTSCVDNVSRWHELRDCISFHSHMASKCWIRTNYWLVNDDNNGDDTKFMLCCGNPEDVPDEMSHLKSVLKQATLSQDQCLLTEQLSKLEKMIVKMISKIPPGQTITVVICTQGVTTDKKGRTSRDIQHDFWNAMKKLSKLPVKIVMRLCTGSDSVCNVYNKMDARVDYHMDVLDDYWGEVRLDMLSN